jgi:hypothetical protein
MRDSAQKKRAHGPLLLRSEIQFTRRYIHGRRTIDRSNAAAPHANLTDYLNGRFALLSAAEPNMGWSGGITMGSLKERCWVQAACRAVVQYSSLAPGHFFRGPAKSTCFLSELLWADD